MTLKLSPCIAALLGLCAFPVQAADPVIGGWRMVSDQAGTHEYRFAMLPQAVPEGTRFVAVDWKAKKLVCCLTVQGGEVAEGTLRNKLHIPGVWVADLVNDWSGEDAPYRPRLFALTPSGVFRTHQFGGNSVAMRGGLLLPADSHGDTQGRLVIGQESYQSKHATRALADDDGAVDVYTLTPSSGGKRVVVEVPFGTN
jgi:hypothetical protein